MKTPNTPCYTVLAVLVLLFGSSFSAECFTTDPGVTDLGVSAGGDTPQGDLAVAIGCAAGQTFQGSFATALGSFAGQAFQGSNATALGSQGGFATALGSFAGQTFQGPFATALGSYAANTNQGSYAIAIGFMAGETNQAIYAVSIGYLAGQNSQGTAATAIGLNAGQANQGQYATAVGIYAGQTNQAANALAVGAGAGSINQGNFAVAIGSYAGLSNQPSDSIILNASGVPLNGSTNGFYVDPVRPDTFTEYSIFYNPSTAEITYGDSGSIASNPVFLSTLTNQIATASNNLGIATKSDIATISNAITQLSAQTSPSNAAFVSAIAENILTSSNNYGVAIKQNQSLSFPEIPIQTITPTKTVTMKVTSSAKLTPIIYSCGNSAIAVVSNNILQLVGSGTTTIIASQAGNASYNPISASQALIVNKAVQTLSFPAIPAQTFSPFKTIALKATSSAKLSQITYLCSNSAVGITSNNILQLEGTGTTTVTATQSGNTYFAPATATQALIVR